MSNYLTNLADKQWQVIKNIVETKERKRKHPLREMINAISHITKTGWQCILYTMLLNSHLVGNGNICNTPNICI